MIYELNGLDLKYIHDTCQCPLLSAAPYNIKQEERSPSWTACNAQSVAVAIGYLSSKKPYSQMVTCPHLLKGSKTSVSPINTPQKNDTSFLIFYGPQFMASCYLYLIRLSRGHKTTKTSLSYKDFPPVSTHISAVPII